MITNQNQEHKIVYASDLTHCMSPYVNLYIVPSNKMKIWVMTYIKNRYIAENSKLGKDGTLKQKLSRVRETSCLKEKQTPEQVINLVQLNIMCHNHNSALKQHTLNWISTLVIRCHHFYATLHIHLSFPRAITSYPL